MKKIVTFEKKITFPSMIGEITTLDLNHNLKFIDKNNIEGELILTGKYKLTEASRLEEDFEYKLPTEILLTEKLDLSTAKIEIEDFYYEIENDDIMVCHIEIKIEGVEEIDIAEEQEEIIETRECDAEEKLPEQIEIPKKQEKKEQEETISIENKKNEEIKKEDKIITSIFSSLEETEETYSTYSVHILRQEETINSLIEKFKITKEDLEKYNDLSNLSIGTKIIIPMNNE